jgi:hypothetical protein
MEPGIAVTTGSREGLEYIETIARGGQGDVQLWLRDGVKVVAKVIST